MLTSVAPAKAAGLAAMGWSCDAAFRTVKLLRPMTAEEDTTAAGRCQAPSAPAAAAAARANPERFPAPPSASVGNARETGRLPGSARRRP